MPPRQARAARRPGMMAAPRAAMLLDCECCVGSPISCPTSRTCRQCARPCRTLSSASRPGCHKTPRRRLNEATIVSRTRDITVKPPALRELSRLPVYRLWQCRPRPKHQPWRTSRFSLGRVEERRGSLGHAATLRFLSPLIEPGLRISRTRLSDKTQVFALERL